MGLCVIPTKRFTVLGINDTSTSTFVRRQDSAVTYNYNNSSNNNSKNNAVKTSTCSNDDNNKDPIIRLDDFILHDRRNITSAIQNKLISSLKNHGYILLSTSCTSRPGKVIQSLRNSLDTDLFPPYISTITTPTTTPTNDLTDLNDEVVAPQETTSRMTVANVSKLKTSKDEIYISEKGIPMYKLGYELCEDNVREVFRIAAGDPDSANVWPDDDDDDDGTSTSTIDNKNNNNRSIRNVWLQGLGLMRQITDIALDLVLSSVSSVSSVSSSSNVNGITNNEKIQSERNDCNISLQQQQQRRQYRPYSTVDSWMKNPTNNPLQERRGDFSVLYAMQYFNSNTYTTTTTTSINDRKHEMQAVINSNHDKNSTSNDNISHTVQLLKRKLPQDGVAVKEHVDPSLFVCEPFLCPYSRGLQVWNRFHHQQQQQEYLDDENNPHHCNNATSNDTAAADDCNNWIDCDGYDSPIIRRHLHNNYYDINKQQQQQQQQQQQRGAEEKNEILLLFVGKAIQSIRYDIEPTLHRVVVGSQPRRCVIYEQKYAEFFPLPTF